jgi:hypothetical protein
MLPVVDVDDQKEVVRVSRVAVLAESKTAIAPAGRMTRWQTVNVEAGLAPSLIRSRLERDRDVHHIDL